MRAAGGIRARRAEPWPRLTRRSGHGRDGQWPHGHAHLRGGWRASGSERRGGAGRPDARDALHHRTAPGAGPGGARHPPGSGPGGPRHRGPPRAPRPAIGTPEELTRARLAAQEVYYSDPASAGRTSCGWRIVWASGTRSPRRAARPAAAKRQWHHWPGRRRRHWADPNQRDSGCRGCRARRPVSEYPSDADDVHGDPAHAHRPVRGGGGPALPD